MGAKKKATVYVEESLYKAARIRAAKTDRTASDIFNEALESHLFEELEEIEDLKIIEKRKHEKSIPLEKALKKLKLNG